MNRINRITAILTQLQSKRIVTAKTIAERFNISLRTVYRDIKTLQEAGVPIGSENGVGYFIVDGYKLPPVMFTEEEANALITAEKLVLQKKEASLTKNYVSALIKIKSVLRNSQKEKIELLESRIGADAKYTFSPTSNYLEKIQKAITESIVLKIEYQSLYKNEFTKRNIKPLAFYFTENDWVVIAHCNLRNALREFRLDQIKKLNFTETHFTDYKDFNLKTYFKKTRKLNS